MILWTGCIQRTTYQPRNIAWTAIKRMLKSGWTSSAEYVHSYLQQDRDLECNKYSCWGTWDHKWVDPLFNLDLNPWLFKLANQKAMIEEAYWHCTTEMNMSGIRTLMSCPIYPGSISVFNGAILEQPTWCPSGMLVLRLYNGMSAENRTKLLQTFALLFFSYGQWSRHFDGWISVL